MVEIILKNGDKVVAEHDDGCYPLFMAAEDALNKSDWAVKILDSDKGLNHAVDYEHNADTLEDKVKNDGWQVFDCRFQANGIDSWMDARIACKPGVYGTENDAKTIFEDAVPLFNGDVYKVTIHRKRVWHDDEGNELVTFDEDPEPIYGVVFTDGKDPEDQLLDYARAVYITGE